jgi:hypothetical protein
MNHQAEIQFFWITEEGASKIKNTKKIRQRAPDIQIKPRPMVHYTSQVVDIDYL